MIELIGADNSVRMTRQQHEATAAPFLAALGSSDTFIGRLELFLAEMDRRVEIGANEANFGAPALVADARMAASEVAHA